MYMEAYGYLVILVAINKCYSCNTDNMTSWVTCSTVRNGVFCSEVFKDGVCNPQCNNEQCLYDGFDCHGELQTCNPLYDTYCKMHYANGHCDKGCDMKECSWDGLDCDTTPKRLSNGTLVVTVMVELVEYREMSGEFVRKLGHVLRSVVRVMKDDHGDPMIYACQQNSGDVLSDGNRDKRGTTGVHVWDAMLTVKRSLITKTQVYLEIDNRGCHRNPINICFDNARTAARFLTATFQGNHTNLNIPVIQVQSLATTTADCGGNAFTDESQVLTCKITGQLVNGITWFRQGVKVITCTKSRNCSSFDPLYKVITCTKSRNCSSFDEQQFTILRVTEDDIGRNWTCIDGSNIPGKVSEESSCTLTPGPAATTADCGEKSSIGASHVLTCQIKGIITNGINWFRQSDLIIRCSAARYCTPVDPLYNVSTAAHPTDNQQLTIPIVTEDDFSKIWTCIDGSTTPNLITARSSCALVHTTQESNEVNDGAETVYHGVSLFTIVVYFIYMFL